MAGREGGAGETLGPPPIEMPATSYEVRLCERENLSNRKTCAIIKQVSDSRRHTRARYIFPGKLFSKTVQTGGIRWNWMTQINKTATERKANQRELHIS